MTTAHLGGSAIHQDIHENQLVINMFISRLANLELLCSFEMVRHPAELFSTVTWTLQGKSGLEK